VARNNRIARLNADGTLDLGFDPNANNSVVSIAVEPFFAKYRHRGLVHHVGGVTRKSASRG
jgi:hypothetical protein